MPWDLMAHSLSMSLLLLLCSLVLASIVLTVYVTDYKGPEETKIEDIPSVR